MHKKTRSYFTLFAVFLMMTLLFTAPAAYAASVGNPDTLGKSGAVSLGMEYDHSKHDLELKSGSASYEGGGTETFDASNMRLKARTAYVVGTVGILPNVDAFVGLGINNAKLGLNMEYPGGSDALEIKDGSNVAWKAGVRAHLTEIAGINVGAMAQYSAYKMDGTFSVNGQDLANYFAPASYHTDTDVSEWQAAMTASKQMGRFNPYAGVTYSRVKVENNTSISVAAGEESMPYSVTLDAEARNKHNVGVVVGTNVALMGNLSANFEGRFVNEKAGTASLSYAF